MMMRLRMMTRTSSMSQMTRSRDGSGVLRGTVLTISLLASTPLSLVDGVIHGDKTNTLS